MRSHWLTAGYTQAFTATAATLPLAVCLPTGMMSGISGPVLQAVRLDPRGIDVTGS